MIAKLSYKGTENVAIYAFSSGKFLNIKVYACVKDLTNIMSGYVHLGMGSVVAKLLACQLDLTPSLGNI